MKRLLMASTFLIALSHGAAAQQTTSPEANPDPENASGFDGASADTGSDSSASMQQKRRDPGIQAGEQVPADIEQYQDSDLWDRDGADQAPQTRGSGTFADSDDAREARNSDRMDRRARLGRRAMRSAQYAMPGTNFSGYRFETEAGRRIIEVAGISRQTGNRVEVDVWPNGRIESISEVIGFRDVPTDIRSAIEEEITGFRPAQVQRSMLADFDVYYEFAGFSASGRPATASIRADGSDLSVRYLRAG